MIDYLNGHGARLPILAAKLAIEQVLGDSYTRLHKGWVAFPIIDSVKLLREAYDAGFAAGCQSLKDEIK